MRRIAIRYGLMMLGGFITFFLLMHLLGQSTNFTLRIFNGVIHLGIIYLAIKEYTKVKDSSEYNYLSEVAIGMYTSFFGVIGFTIFMTLFLSFSPSFMEAVRLDNPNLSSALTPFTTSLFIFAEGIVISLIGSYTIARWIEMNQAKN